MRPSEHLLEPMKADMRDRQRPLGAILSHKGIWLHPCGPTFCRAPSSSGATYHTTLLMWVGSESSGRGLTRKQHLWRFSKLTQHSDDHQQELKLWSLGVDFTCTGEIHVIHYFFPFQVRCDSLFCGCVPPNDVPRSRHLFSLHCGFGSVFGLPTGGIQQSCYFLFFFNFLY